MKQSKKGTKTTRKPATGKAVLISSKKYSVSHEERLRMIADAAYYRAEHKGFQGGNPEHDWLASEAEIDRLITG